MVEMRAAALIESWCFCRRRVRSCSPQQAQLEEKELARALFSAAQESVTTMRRMLERRGTRGLVGLVQESPGSTIRLGGTGG